MTVKINLTYGHIFGQKRKLGVFSLRNLRLKSSIIISRVHCAFIETNPLFSDLFQD